jgi:DNA excision repair protein ERCC-5
VAQRKQAEQKQRFKRMDQYHLPEMEQDFSELGAPDDARILSAEELQEYSRQFEGMEDTNLSDYSNIDFSSPFFAALPDEDRYRILNHARLRSRLRMGYSKEQLDAMFPDRMAFSKFQVERVARRNELSQRLMNLQGREGDFSISRVAGQKNKEYVLVRNEGSEGGWVMSFVGNKGELEGERNKPIDVENINQEAKDPIGESDEDEEFEDVPIEGLNRLPKPKPILPESLLGIQTDEAKELRRALYESRIPQSGVKKRPDKNQKQSMPNYSDLLFLWDETDDIFLGFEEDLHEGGIDSETDLREAITMSLGHQGFQSVMNEDEALQKALAMSAAEDYSGNGKGKGNAVDVPEAVQIEDSIHDEEFQLAVAESRAANTLQNNGESSRITYDNPLAVKPFGGLAAPLDLTKSSSILVRKKTDGNLILPPVLLPNNHKEKPANKKDDEDSEPIPLPPWFAKNGVDSVEEELEKEQKRAVKEAQGQQNIVGAVEFESFENKHVSEDFNTVSSENPKEHSIEGGGFEPLKAFDTPCSNLTDVSRAYSFQVSSPGTQGGNDNNDKEIEWSGTDDERGSTLIGPSPPVVGLLTSSPAPPKPGDSIRENLVEIPAEEVELEDFDLSFELEQTPPQDEILPEDVDEGEMIAQMAQESLEHARFAAEISKDKTTDALLDYEQELKALRMQQKKDRRDTDEVTQVMVQECQQLLKLFGLPYITAPMEAEAQCAELVRLGLVDGIVTDDSDVFLFGGTRVYRYMFNDRQVVQCYLMSDFEREFSLDQKRLIATAQLLGSDYTEGIPNVGPVTAIELLAEFSNDNELQGFKDWWTRVQQGIDKPSESNTVFRKKFKKNVAKIFLPPSFPDPLVEDAYLNAIVDSDPSPFEWGVPDLQGLREFLMSALGWTQERTDQTLVPVIKDMNRKQAEGTQANITSFIDGTTAAGSFAPRVTLQGKSSRIKKAISSLHEKARRPSSGEERGYQENTDDTVDESARKKRPMSMREIAAAVGKSTAAENGDEQHEGDTSELVLEKVPAKKKQKRTVTWKESALASKRGRKKKAS